MSELMLFTDGSVNTRSKVGYGAYLLVYDQSVSVDSLNYSTKIQRFENTSSTKLELQTLLWALGELKLSDQKIILFTDSQNIVGLPARRERLEKSSYLNSRNRLLNNAELYQTFFSVTDLMDVELVKVQGHRVSSEKNRIDRLFTLVDKASRKALRENEN